MMVLFVLIPWTSASGGYVLFWGKDLGGDIPWDSNSPSSPNDFIDIAAGCCHNLVLKSDGSLAAWGRNYYGQCDVPPGN